MHITTKTTAKEIFTYMVEKYHGLYLEVKKTHDNIATLRKSNHGHGLDHDLTVAQYSAIITEDERVGEMAWVAGLMHSADKHFSGEKERLLIDQYFSLLPKGEFDNEELKMMREAIAEHSKLNSPLDNPVTIVLKDADRLANLGAINFIRCGQQRPDIPACLLEFMDRLHPQATFREPMSCYDMTFYNLEWEEMLRMPIAMALGRKYFYFIRNFQQMAREQVEYLGLYPWPIK